MKRFSWENEWRTWVALGLVYAVWALATIWIAEWSLLLAILIAGVAAAFHSSLNHEALHGHPTGNAYVNGALVFPALMLCIPYLRFRDTHLAHHIDTRLTDPYDDPESNFLEPKVWNALPRPVRALLRFNNTLLGRMLIGPVVSQITFMRADLRAIAKGDGRVLAGWILHVPAVLIVVWWAISVGQMPGWAYLAQAYLGVSLLKIRTYLEHRAHRDSPARTVVIEDRGLLALLFLNNNYHIVHHSHPSLPWHRMPVLYFADTSKYLDLNQSYRYRSYGEVFRRYLFKAKDPVPHPLWPN